MMLIHRSYHLEKTRMSANKSLLIPMLLITLGTGWLLTTSGYAPQIDWIWTLGIAVAGVMTFIIGGFDKVTFVVGAFLLMTSLISVLRQTGRIDFNVEVPILMITAGVLQLIAHSRLIPTPEWLAPQRKQSPND
jgi:uncharacterized membrane protein